MVLLMKMCNSCGRYTLENACPSCGAGSESAHPGKYSREDKYARYRRKELYPQYFSTD